MSVTRRVWFYLVTLVALGVFAAGLGQLLALVFDVTIKSSNLGAVGQSGFIRQQLSLGLAMLVIGWPLWFFFWRAITRRVAGVPEETGAAMRKFFLNLILTVTALVGLTSGANFIGWLLAGVPVNQFSSGGLAALIVAAIIWVYHWRVSEAEGHPSPAARTLRRWYVYILASFSLVWLAVSPVQLVNLAVLSLPFRGSSLVQAPFWNDPVRNSIAMLMLGGISWYFHWLHIAREDLDATLRQVYFYLVAILGGVIATLVALTITLYRLLLWLVGGATAPGGPYFQFLGWAIPTMLVGAIIWAYHRWQAQSEADRVNEQRLSAQRIHIYLMSFLGLGTLVSGLIILLSTILDLLINAASTPVALTPGWWRSQVSLCLALLLVGTPLWLYYWSQALQRAEAAGLAEWRARSRRVFLYLIVGILIITLVVDLVTIVYQVLGGILAGNLGISFLRNARLSIETLLIAAPLLWYHWQIVRGEQHRGAEAAAMHKTVTIVVSPQAVDLVSRLEDKLGFKVRVMHRLDTPGEAVTPLTDEELGKVVTDVQATPGSKVLLISEAGRLIVIPYQGK